MREPLVIGYEDSESGRDALALGRQLALALGAKPVVVQVVILPETVLTPAELKAALAEAGKPDLGAVAELEELEPEGEALVGTSAAGSLHDIAEERGALGIVVGSSHRGAIGRVLPGGTAKRLLAGSPCAVALANRGHARAQGPPRRLAVAYDGSPESERALTTAASLAERWGAHITLLAAVETTAPPLYPPLTPLPSEEMVQREEARMKTVAEQALASLPDGVEADHRILEGPVERVIADESRDFDLLLVGSRGYGPLGRTLLGSTSRALVDAANCSVLAVPRRSDASSG